MTDFIVRYQPPTMGVGGPSQLTFIDPLEDDPDGWIRSHDRGVNFTHDDVVKLLGRLGFDVSDER